MRLRNITPVKNSVYCSFSNTVRQTIFGLDHRMIWQGFSGHIFTRLSNFWSAWAILIPPVFPDRSPFWVIPESVFSNATFNFARWFLHLAALFVWWMPCLTVYHGRNRRLSMHFSKLLSSSNIQNLSHFRSSSAHAVAVSIACWWRVSISGTVVSPISSLQCAWAVLNRASVPIDPPGKHPSRGSCAGSCEWSVPSGCYCGCVA